MSERKVEFSGVEEEFHKHFEIKQCKNGDVLVRVKQLNDVIRETVCIKNFVINYTSEGWVPTTSVRVEGMRIIRPSIWMIEYCGQVLFLKVSKDVISVEIKEIYSFINNEPTHEEYVKMYEDVTENRSKKMWENILVVLDQFMIEYDLQPLELSDKFVDDDERKKAYVQAELIRMDFVKSLWIDYVPFEKKHFLQVLNKVDYWLTELVIKVLDGIIIEAHARFAIVDNEYSKPGYSIKICSDILNRHNFLFYLLNTYVECTMFDETVEEFKNFELSKKSYADYCVASFINYVLESCNRTDCNWSTRLHFLYLLHPIFSGRFLL